MKERLPDIPEYVMDYADVQRLASQLGISLDGLNGDDYAMCDHRFERFVRPVEAAVKLGIVVLAENCGMIRDHKGERALHGAAYWQRAAEVAEARIEAVKAIHKPFKVFDECDHDHGDEPADESPGATVVDVDGIGLTCNHMYSICTACCTDDGQTEYCADGHDHGRGKPICPTTAALENS